MVEIKFRGADEPERLVAGSFHAGRQQRRERAVENVLRLDEPPRAEQDSRQRDQRHAQIRARLGIAGDDARATLVERSRRACPEICRRGRLGRNERVGRASQNARGGIALQVRNSQREAALALARFENLRRLALSRVEGPALSGIEGLDSRDERDGPAGRQVERQLARAEEVLDALEPERDVPRVLEAVIPERFRLDLAAPNWRNIRGQPG